MSNLGHVRSDSVRRLLFAWMIFSAAMSGCDVSPAPSPASPARDNLSQARVEGDGPADNGTPRGLSAPAARDELPRIVAFGDSLTAGLGVPPQETYPAKLQARLHSLGYRYQVINAGVSGETTAGGVRRVFWILKSRPRVVILELGANDGLRGLTVEQTSANLEKIILTMQETGVTVILAGMKLPPNYGADYTSRFEAMFHDLAERHHLAFIPFFLADVGGQADLNQADGLHPTGRGYTRIVENVLKVIEPVLRKIDRQERG